jgi:deoxyribodipyrimidine photolyase-related protein
MQKAVLIYPHQLFEDSPLLKEDVKIFLIEEPLMFTQYSFHKQKLILHRASMQAYKEFLVKKGFKPIYVNFNEIKKTENIAEILKTHKVTKVYFYDLVDNWLHKKLSKALNLHKIDYEIAETPLFLTSQKNLDDFFLPLLQKKKRFFMKTFYEWQRKRLNVLIEKNGNPKGGKWSYDEDNRKKLPKNIVLPKNPAANCNAFVLEAQKYVKEHFPKNYGFSESFFYPVTSAEAKAWLDTFLKEKLKSFGPYEDAIAKEESFLFHSVLSPLLNIGILSPQYVLSQTLAYAEENEVPLASLEGFIRQLIGWREYIRAVYVYLGSEERTKNYFGANRKIPESFWQGNTGIPPLDDTIKTVLQHAYSHHISRLMLVGNFMTLCGFKPNEAYRWFMELYIDAYDWVMVPNVYSMALYADGGLITTKPYISGSAYILKMSDYKKGPWTKIWDALFWNFVDKHYDLLSKEGRLGFIGTSYKKMPEATKMLHLKQAQDFLKSL